MITGIHSVLPLHCVAHCLLCIYSSFCWYRITNIMGTILFLYFLFSSCVNTQSGNAHCHLDSCQSNPQLLKIFPWSFIGNIETLYMYVHASPHGQIKIGASSMSLPSIQHTVCLHMPVYMCMSVCASKSCHTGYWEN